MYQEFIDINELASTLKNRKKPIDLLLLQTDPIPISNLYNFFKKSKSNSLVSTLFDTKLELENNFVE